MTVKKKKRKKSRRKRKRRRISIILFLLLTLIVINLTDHNETKANSISNTNIKSNNNIINFLVVGIDTNDSKKNVSSRTDTIMVCSLNLDKKKGCLISIPRDTRVKIDGRKYKDKINHAYAYGGIDLTLDTVENLLNIPIDYYVKVDYKGLERIIDELGGVQVEVPMDMKYIDPYSDPPLHINLKRGLQVLNGKEAIQFVRFRKGYANQDLGRIKSQQEFIKSVLNEIIKPKNLIKIPKFINNMEEYVQTNITKTHMIKYALKLLTFEPSNLKMFTVPGKPIMINRIWYYEPDLKALNEILSNI